MRHYKPNPYGLFPLGNRPEGEAALARFGSLSEIALQLDETRGIDLMLELLSWCSLESLCQLSASSAAWYVFIHSSDCWKRTYAQLHADQTVFVQDWKTSAIASVRPNFRHRPICCSHPLYNDTLFQSWLCTVLPCDYKLPRCGLKKECTVDKTLTHNADLDGGAHARESSDDGHAAETVQARQFLYKSRMQAIPKRHTKDLSVDAFHKEFEAPGVPLIIEGLASNWKLYEHLGGDLSRLATSRIFRDDTLALRCEHTTMTPQNYVRYAQQQQDERPIYLFDAEFAAVLHEGLYEVPAYFSRDDLFHVLEKERPKYRWLIAGPKRGGSSFHVDPNYTHAWNACLTGRKRWLLFPPHCPPPGVFPSDDMRNVTTPVSLTEWLMNYYSASVTTLAHSGYEGVCEAGEVMFIPAGWWHFVINLEDSVAITQNYVSRTNLGRVVRFLQGMKQSISGIDEDDDSVSVETVQQRRDTLGTRFVDAMRVHDPQMLAEAEREIAEVSAQRKRPRETKIDLLDDQSEGFSFSF